MSDPFDFFAANESQSLSSVSLVHPLPISESFNLQTRMAEEIEKLKTEKKVLEDMLKQIQEEKKQHQTVSFKEIKPSEGEIKDYDCRIVVDSFFTLLQNQVWKIEFRNWEEYQKKIVNPTLKIAVLGYENVGKSWMVGNLMGSRVPQGKHTKTTGVCILYPTSDKIPWIALDTPGTNVSVKVEALKKDLEKYFDKKKDLLPDDILRMLYGDNILIETLLQEFVMNHAEVLLVVVGKLRRDDQRLIRRMKNQKKNNKKILIIHNLLETKLKSDVEDIIKEDIMQTFNGVEKNIGVQETENSPEKRNRIVYYENEKNDVEHIIFAHEGSEAGDYYNKSSFEYLRNVITTVSQQTEFDLVKAFENHVNDHFQHYLSTSQKKQEKSEGSEKEKEKVFSMEQEEGQKIPKTFRLNNPEKYELKSNYSNEFGEIKTYGDEGIEEVPFSVKIVTKGEEKFLHVELEIVGDFDPRKCSYTIFGNVSSSFTIRIQGSCLDEEKKEGEVSSIIHSTRKFGNFVVLTQTIQALEGYSLRRKEKPQCDEKTVPGLKIFSWKLYKNVVGYE